jgi:lauroyl/myristoyl acyltransferase
MILVLRPSAALLPYARALAFARSFGFINASMPWYGRRKVLQMRHAFGDTSTRKAAQLAAENLARPLCDSVVLRRALRGLADIDRWRVEQRTTACVDRLKASGESFILATGHFSRQAFMALGDVEVLPQRITSVSLPPTARGLHPRTWWLRYHYGQILDYSRVSRRDIQFVFPDRPGAYRRLVETLGKSDSVVMIHVDAPALANGDSYCRPFAGLDSRPFTMGAARLSRTTRRPIVVCIPYLADDQTIVLDWTRVIRPADALEAGWDRRVSDVILDDIEQAIGRRPGQYLLECLGNRRWDARAERWIL